MSHIWVPLRLQGVTRAVNHALQGLGLEPFYEEMRFHVSVAWFVGPVPAGMGAALAWEVEPKPVNASVHTCLNASVNTHVCDGVEGSTQACETFEGGGVDDRLHRGAQVPECGSDHVQGCKAAGGGEEMRPEAVLAPQTAGSVDCRKAADRGADGRDGGCRDGERRGAVEGGVRKGGTEGSAATWRTRLEARGVVFGPGPAEQKRVSFPVQAIQAKIGAKRYTFKLKAG